MPDVDPRQRLTLTIQTWVAPQCSDGRVMRAIRQAFVDCGFESEQAALRAFVVFSSGVGLLHSTGSAPAAPPDLQARFLDFMLRA
jgi:hypothetical protein